MEISRIRSPGPGRLIERGIATRLKGPTIESAAEQADDVVGGLGDGDSCFLKRLHLALGGAPITRHDRAGVAHALAFGGRPPGDESYGLEPRPCGEQLRRTLLIAAPDLADHHEVRGRR